MGLFSYIDVDERSSPRLSGRARMCEGHSTFVPFRREDRRVGPIGARHSIAAQINGPWIRSSRSSPWAAEGATVGLSRHRSPLSIPRDVAGHVVEVCRHKALLERFDAVSANSASSLTMRR